MKKLLTLSIPVIGILLLYTIVWAGVSNDYFFPMIYGGNTPVPTATATNTPRPTTPVPPPTAIPTLIFVDDPLYEWLYIGAAYNHGESITLSGLVPSFCHDVAFVRFEDHPDGKLAIFKSREIVENTYWCLSEYWAGTWPPPQYPPPPIPLPTPAPPPPWPLPYGEIFYDTFDLNAAIVCGQKNDTDMLRCIYAGKY